MKIRADPGTQDRIRRMHPMQYGFRGKEIVYDPGDDPTITDRYNRCPTCEQWSPCDVRKALEDAITGEQALKEVQRLLMAAYPFQKDPDGGYDYAILVFNAGQAMGIISNALNEKQVETMHDHS